MNLDPRTMLFSIFLVYAISVLSLFVAASGNGTDGKRDGMGKWALALLMIDVDHFKHINDTHGHPVGDMVLRKIASVLAERLRGQDFLGRYGGEEFCVIAPDTDAGGGLTLAEHLRAAIASTPFSGANGELGVTISIGVAVCTANGKGELNKVLAEADIALYNARQSGRNKAVVFEEVQS